MKGVHEVLLHPPRGGGCVSDAVVHQCAGKNHGVVLVAEEAAKAEEEEDEGFQPGSFLGGGLSAAEDCRRLSGVVEMRSAAHLWSSVGFDGEIVMGFHQKDGRALLLRYHVAGGRRQTSGDAG